MCIVFQDSSPMSRYLVFLTGVISEHACHYACTFATMLAYSNINYSNLTSLYNIDAFTAAFIAILVWDVIGTGSL